MDFSAPWKSRLSAPQLQAQLSRLTDRIRLAHSSPKELRGQVTRIEDLSTRMSLTLVYWQVALRALPTSSSKISHSPWSPGPVAKGALRGPLVRVLDLSPDCRSMPGTAAVARFGFSGGCLLTLPHFVFVLLLPVSGEAGSYCFLKIHLWLRPDYCAGWKKSLSQVALPLGRVCGKCLTSHDYITNVQKRLGNRTWTGFGQCRLCGSLLDHQMEHCEICSAAEATRGHYACVHAVLGGLKLADDPGIPRNPQDSQKRNPGRLISFLPLLSQDAARLWRCVCPPPTQQQLEETLRMQPLIVNYRVTFDARAPLPSLVWTTEGRPHPAGGWQSRSRPLLGPSCPGKSGVVCFYELYCRMR